TPDISRQPSLDFTGRVKTSALRSITRMVIKCGIIIVALILLSALFLTLKSNPPAVINRHTYLTNSIGMTFVLVQPGTFIMGSQKKEPLGASDEPLHEVEITKAFYLGVYEVTHDEYERLAVKNAHPPHFSLAGGARSQVDGIDPALLRRFPAESMTWE